jgi:hypothetical protein
MGSLFGFNAGMTLWKRSGSPFRVEETPRIDLGFGEYQASCTGWVA